MQLNPYTSSFVKSKYHNENELLSDTIVNPLELNQPPKSLTSSVFNLPPAPEPPKPQAFPDSEGHALPPDAEDKVKALRKERARQFMADLLKRKKMEAEKEDPQETEEAESSPDRSTFQPNREFDDVLVSAEQVLPNLISSLIQKQTNPQMDIVLPVQPPKAEPTSSSATLEQPVSNTARRTNSPYSPSRKRRRSRSSSYSHGRRSRSRSRSRSRTRRYRSRSRRRRSRSRDRRSRRRYRSRSRRSRNSRSSSKTYDSSDSEDRRVSLRDERSRRRRSYSRGRFRSRS